jgi:hypothetical protein
VFISGRVPVRGRLRTSQTVCNIARRRFYDTCCFLTYAFSLRFPTILSRTLFVLDRFHEEGYPCGPTNSDRLRRLAVGLCSSNTKCLNALFADSRYSLRYLRKHHFMPFVFYSVHVYQHEGDVPRVYRHVRHRRRRPDYHFLPGARMPLQ